MPYITTKLSPMFKQISLDDILNGEVNVKSFAIPNYTNTRTYYAKYINSDFLEKFNIIGMIKTLENFNEVYSSLIDADKNNLYTRYKIPKHSGGLRSICAPTTELKTTQRFLVQILKESMFATYHTSAFAYIEHRCTLDAVKKHQRNDSKWIMKADFSNFFDNTSLDFVMKMFSMIFPFSEIIKIPAGEKVLRRALSICFLDGGLPQGSPASPIITNIMMIPIDHEICNGLKKKDDGYVYTRYSDDINVSSRVSFSHSDIIEYISAILNNFEAPFSFNETKTRYGSTSGRNWMLGVMLNKDNNITVGYKKKKEFKAMLTSYINDKIKGVKWTIDDIRELSGKLSYYKMVEREYFNDLIDRYNKKYNFDFAANLAQDLKTN